MQVFRQKQETLSEPVNGPELVHLVLPPYEIPELIVVGGVLVENRGRMAANNIKIAIDYQDAATGKIRHLRVVTDAPYILRGGGEQESYATFRLRQLGPGQRVFVYFSGPTCTQPRVTVTHYEG